MQQSKKSQVSVEKKKKNLNLASTDEIETYEQVQGMQKGVEEVKEDSKDDKPEISAAEISNYKSQS